MDKVVLDGIEYVKASTVAKQFHYTSDYIGQLCRAKKIDARLVGRTWFVQPESVKEHKKNTHQKATDLGLESARDEDIVSNVKIKRIVVNAPLKNKTAKSTFRTTTQAAFVRPEKTAALISYHGDAETLLPNLDEKAPPAPDSVQPVRPHVKRFLNIEPAFAKKLKISGDKKKPVSFSTTDLPDVALSGKLNVSTYNDLSEQPAPKSPPFEPLEEQQAESAEDSGLLVPIQRDSPVDSQGEEKHSLDSNPTLSLWIRTMPLSATLLAIVVSVVLLSAVSEVVVSEVVSTANISLEIEYFWQLFTQ
jgi:hypothetical protein